MEEEKNNEQKQDQQIESKLKDMGREVAKNAKKKVKVIAMNVISSVSLLAFKISLIVVVVILVGGIIEWIHEKFSSEEAAKIMYEGESAEVIKDKTEEYDKLQNNIFSAAGRGYVDEIIEADQTRKYIIGAFEMLFTKREDRPTKKHGTV